MTQLNAKLTADLHAAQKALTKNFKRGDKVYHVTSVLGGAPFLCPETVYAVREGGKIAFVGGAGLQGHPQDVFHAESEYREAHRRLVVKLREFASDKRFAAQEAEFAADQYEKALNEGDK